ncbi:MAG: hypothetical protein IJU80_06615 [Lachnospiraceae bacterium]|nr:hypothetical protein [Lachnospiraceae bacterium]
MSDVIVLICLILVIITCFFKLLVCLDDLNAPKKMRQGYWITCYEDQTVLRCVLCNEVCAYDYYGSLWASDYCPCCGAWMCDEKGCSRVDP